MADPDTHNVLVVSSGGVLRHFFMTVEPQNAFSPIRNSNWMVYVFEWEDGAFSCAEILQQDYSGLDCGGLDGSGVPNRWSIGGTKEHPRIGLR
jgi:broad specificity phosphatase PhoE